MLKHMPPPCSQVMCTTSTLAQGMNLPARLVSGGRQRCLPALCDWDLVYQPCLKSPLDACTPCLTLPCPVTYSGGPTPLPPGALLPTSPPAPLQVVIKGTRRYVGSEAADASGYQEYERSTCLQMVGRAGRPQFDTEGVAVIMTQRTVGWAHNCQALRLPASQGTFHLTPLIPTSLAPPPPARLPARPARSTSSAMSS